MAHTENKFDLSSQIFGMVEKNLPEQDMNEDTQPIDGREFFLWMIGITGALFLLRYAFLLLF
ncbi:MAG: hypothetical protein ABR936_09055 [Bacteroidota bacterium]|jgi:hypothetical protein